MRQPVRSSSGRCCSVEVQGTFPTSGRAETGPAVLSWSIWARSALAPARRRSDRVEAHGYGDCSAARGAGANAGAVNAAACAAAKSARKKDVRMMIYKMALHCSDDARGKLRTNLDVLETGP